MQDKDIDRSAGQQAGTDAPSREGVIVSARRVESTEAVLGNEIEILIDQRLPHLDKGAVKAYGARAYKTNDRAVYFVMVCENHLVPQGRAASTYAALLNPSLAHLIACGTVYWPPDKSWRYCFVYENTMGRPLIAPDDTSLAMGWRPDIVMQAIIKPMINVMLDLRDADIVHGNICLNNMFDGGHKSIERVILGEYMSAPPGYAQPLLYETIERAMCNPIARGAGAFAEDLYSFGVSLAVILRRHNPMAGFSDEKIIKEKIELGSYAALVGNERFSGAILELLRGLLYDDNTQRWTHDEVRSWMDGQRLSPKQSVKRKKAARPIELGDEKYFRQPLLAMDLHKHPVEALQMIETNELQQWVERSLEDTQAGSRLAGAIDAAQEQGRGPGYTERLLSRVAIALDPDGPVRYRKLAAHPDGFPYALAEAVALKHDVQIFVDVINQQLVMQWLDAQMNIRTDIGAMIARYDSCRAFLRQATMGYGLERCLYYLCPEAPCMSDRLRNYYVTRPEDVMFAYEHISKQASRPELFIDRHVAAFLSVNDRKVIDLLWVELNSAEIHKKIFGNIKVLSNICTRMRNERFPGVTAWIADIVKPLYERYHDRDLREQMKKRVEKLKDSGDVIRMVAIFEDTDLIQADFVGFRAAMQNYNTLRNEHAEAEHRLAHPDGFARETGTEVAAIVSGILAGVIILAFAFIFFVSKGA